MSSANQCGIRTCRPSSIRKLEEICVQLWDRVAGEMPVVDLSRTVPLVVIGGGRAALHVVSRLPVALHEVRVPQSRSQHDVASHRVSLLSGLSGVHSCRM
jgi:hypothetical protein